MGGDSGTSPPSRMDDKLKLLLTSGGITNPSILDALVDLLGKPIADSTALCIPTAQWGHPLSVAMKKSPVVAKSESPVLAK